MKLRALFSAIFLISSSVGYVSAQQPQQQEDESITSPKVELWHADMGDVSKVYVAVSQIVTIALHPYKLNGENLVTELTIDTLGNNTIRFYYVHPDDETINTRDVKENIKYVRKKASRETSNQKASNEVPSVKFPEGTYAHSIEYQVDSIKTLMDMYKSIIKVWERSNNLKLNEYSPKKDN